jgi:hypothetical protein
LRAGADPPLDERPGFDTFRSRTMDHRARRCRSEAAKLEQQTIIDLLEKAMASRQRPPTPTNRLVDPVDVQPPTNGGDDASYRYAHRR